MKAETPWKPAKGARIDGHPASHLGTVRERPRQDCTVHSSGSRDKGLHPSCQHSGWHPSPSSQRTVAEGVAGGPLHSHPGRHCTRGQMRSWRPAPTRSRCAPRTSGCTAAGPGPTACTQAAPLVRTSSAKRAPARRRGCHTRRLQGHENTWHRRAEAGNDTRRCRKQEHNIDSTGCEETPIASSMTASSYSTQFQGGACGAVCYLMMASEEAERQSFPAGSSSRARTLSVCPRSFNCFSPLRGSHTRIAYMHRTHR
jgi:hypothetical protein